MYAIGMMAMPADFRYREVFLKGRPKHDRLDAFRIRHPQMDVGKRAKIFAPFDALRGFDFAIMCKNELYMDKVTLSPEDAEELSRRLEILHNLTYNGRMARENRVQVSLITSLAMMRNMRHTGSGASIRPSPVSAGTWMPR